MKQGYEENMFLAKKHEEEVVQDKGYLTMIWETIRGLLPGHTLSPTQHIMEVPYIGVLQYERATKDVIWDSSEFSKDAYLYVDKERLEKLFTSGNISLLPDEFLENLAKGKDFGRFIRVPMICEKRMWHRQSGEQYNGVNVPTLARVRFGFPGVAYTPKHKHFIHTYFKNNTKYNPDDLVGITIGEFKGRNDGTGFRQFVGLKEVKEQDCGFGKFTKGEKHKGIKVFSEYKRENNKNFYCNETYYIDQINAPNDKKGRRVMYSPLQQNFNFSGGTDADNIRGDFLIKDIDGNDFAMKFQGNDKVITKTISKDIDLTKIDVNIPVAGPNLHEKFITIGGAVAEHCFDIDANKVIVTKKNDLTDKKSFFVMNKNDVKGHSLQEPSGLSNVIQEVDPSNNHLTYCDFLFGDKFIRLKVGKKAGAAGSPDVARNYDDVKGELENVAQALYSGDMDYLAKIKKDQNNKCVFEEVEIKFPDGNEVRLVLNGAQQKYQFGRDGTFMPQAPMDESRCFYDAFNKSRVALKTKPQLTLDDLDNMALELA